LRAAAALIAALVLAGCGSEDEEDEQTAVAGTSLTITVDPDGEGGESASSAEVTCTEDTATSPCPQLTLLEAADLSPVPPDRICTEVFGGPDVATVSGTLNGEEVDAQLSRANGCEIERFDRFTPVLREVFPDYHPGEAIAP
jgi:hypothetical protein